MLCTLSVRTALITQERINESELSYAEMKSEYLKNDIKTFQKWMWPSARPIRFPSFLK